MPYIKSHSNYVLNKKHQDISDGTIWERDITTIGGVNQFAAGQIPIYKSSNFIITVRNDGKFANQYNQIKWKENEESGHTWTLESLSGMTSEFEDQNDVKIVLKQDYYDFCDFAYYGSLTEMFRASINDVLSRFPGELYITSGINAYYTSTITDDFEVVKKNVILGDMECTLVSNPFGIDIHSVKKPFEGKKLKFFAENGYINYKIINDDNAVPITNWKTNVYIARIKSKDTLDSIYGSDAFYYEYLKDKLNRAYPENGDREIWWNESESISGESGISGSTNEKSKNQDGLEFIGDSGYTQLLDDFAFGEIHEKFLEYNNGYWIEKNGIKDSDIYPPSAKTKAYEERDERASSDSANTYTVGHGAMCGDAECYILNPICKGYKLASTSANTIVIESWIGDNNNIIYLNRGNFDFHIRPNENFISIFYNECDNFEKLLLNRKTTPLYNASFSVIKENEKGYYREIENFEFPKSYGGYNIDASSSKFNEYTKKLSEIGNFYDMIFTDNLYRSMTHEAIKNFDWTYTREFNVGDEEEYVHGGDKIQKALRVFAREFDEILSYINNIRNYNRVTYDERNNIPDYFLIDEVENKGWDVCLVHPYDLTEYVFDGESKTLVDSGDTNVYDEVFQLYGNGTSYPLRQFTQNSKKEIYPYSKKNINDYPNGYFVTCSEGNTPCWYENSNEGAISYNYLDASNSGTTYYDEERGMLINRVKSYSNERSYTYMDANNEFMRRLCINSPYIWKHKGTIEGIEMILGMFGLKSKRWVNRLTDNCVKNVIVADYEINEYSSFTNRIEEKWDAVHQMYRIDWINSTKSIVYDYRSTSNYTNYGAQPNYVSYQGLPISYRYEYEIKDESGKTINDAYIKVSPLHQSPDSAQTTTSNSEEAFKNINENNNPVRRRYLYPNFNKNEQLDGNPYFQMDGGWLSKTIENINGNKYNFHFDVDDNIASTCYVSEGTDEEDVIVDNNSIYNETIRNIRRVNTIADLVATPVSDVKDGSICYVSNVETNVAVIDNEVFTINYEKQKMNETVLRWISLKKNGEYIKIGDSKFFSSTIIVYDENFDEATYDLSDKENGYEVKAYISDNGIPFICKADMEGTYTIDSFMILDEQVSDTTTNYFIIDDSYFSNRLASKDDNNGWRRLDETDPEYIRINTIWNYYEGNNPHNGNMVYDGGHEYFTYFKRLFKYPIDNELFDERCYESFYYDLDNEISKYGFKNLIHDDEMVTQYFPYISGLTDTKIHYFGNYYKKDEKSNAPTICEKVLFYGGNTNKISETEKMYKNSNENISVSGYILNQEDMIGGTPYVGDNMKDINIDIIDEITNQIVNNKRLTIKFFLHNKWYTNQGLCEVKYLDSIVMNYLTQMIPSTTIVEIQYIGLGEDVEYQWVNTEEYVCVGNDKYIIQKQQKKVKNE